MAMIDLREARKSFDFYSNLLDLQCGLYGVMGASAIVEQLAAEASNSRDEVVAELTRRQHDALVLSVLFSEQMQKQAPDLLLRLGELTEALQAQNRMVAAANKATAVIQEHKKALAEKNQRPEESATNRGVRKFMERMRQRGYS